MSARTFAQYATHRVGGGLGWGGDDDVPCTCTHGRCYASHGVGWGGVGMMTFLALATLTWHAWSMLRNRWWGGVGCNSIVDLARMVNATQQMVGWVGCNSIVDLARLVVAWGGVGCNSIVDLARMVDATQHMVGWGGV